MRKILDSVVAGCCLAAAFCLVSCDSDLDIQQEYPFTVEAMPVADEIATGNTVEIRLEIVPEGDFSGTVYTLRYFQPEGKGRLEMEDGTVLKPNDRYLLGEKRFRLYCCRATTKMLTTGADSNRLSALKIYGRICLKKQSLPSLIKSCWKTGSHIYCCFYGTASKLNKLTKA